MSAWELAGAGDLLPARRTTVSRTRLAVAGGVRYAWGRLTLETRGWTLLVHEGELEEWGVSGSVGVAAGPQGQGLSFNLGTGYGATGSGLTRLWDQGGAV